MSKDQILAYLREHKQEFFEQYGIESIGLFGSALRNELHDDSDIDLAIEMAASHKNLRNFLAFKRQLEKSFDRPVDLGIESALKPAIKNRNRSGHFVCLDRQSFTLPISLKRARQYRAT